VNIRKIQNVCCKPNGQPSDRYGVTIVELLVVIAIIVSVMAVAVPVVRLTTGDNRISLATQSVRSFVESIAAEAQYEGRSHLIFERNANSPGLCYRLFKGRSRPNYRGEDETSYAIKAPDETVTISTVAGTVAESVDMRFNVFYLYNADSAKAQPFEYLSFRDRPEKYLIYQGFAQDSGSTGGIVRPIVKLYCRLDPRSASSSIPFSRDSLTELRTGSEFAAPMNRNGWAAARAALALRASDNSQANFWPADPVFFPPVGTAVAGDIPNWNATSQRFTSKISQFYISQPPMIDELNFLELPKGVAIQLNGSGFGQIDGVDDRFLPFLQFAFRDDYAMYCDPSIANAIGTFASTDPTQDLPKVRDSLSPIRAAYFPRIEFDASGKVYRAFGMSPGMTALNSSLSPPDGKLSRLAPFQPLTSLYLLVGEDDVNQRSATPLLPADHWIVVSSQTGNAKVVKAEDGVSVGISREIAAASVTER